MKTLPSSAIDHMSNTALQHVPAELLPDNIVKVFEGSNVGNVAPHFVATRANDYFVLDAADTSPIFAIIEGFDVLHDHIVIQNLGHTLEWQNLPGLNAVWASDGTRIAEVQSQGPFTTIYARSIGSTSAGDIVTLYPTEISSPMTFATSNVILSSGEWSLLG